MPRYLSFLGPPGSGKTTQIRMLQARLGAHVAVASVPRLVRGEADLLEALTAAEREELDCHLQSAAEARDRGELAPLVIDRLLFEAVTRLRAPSVVALD